MRLARPQKRQPEESIIPMINVVFLLLIFFLMTAQIAPPAPFEVTPPVSDSEAAPAADLVLHVDAAGRYGFRDATGGEEVLGALAAELPPCAAPCAQPQTVQVRVDASLPAAKLATLMAQLPKAGIRRAEIVTALK